MFTLIVLTHLMWLRSEFQMTGASHDIMTPIHSKIVQFSILHDNLLKIDGCNWGFLKIDRYNCIRCTRSNGAPDIYLFGFLVSGNVLG